MLTDKRGMTVQRMDRQFGDDLRGRQNFAREATCWECGAPIHAVRPIGKAHHWRHTAGSGVGCSRTGESEWHRVCKLALHDTGFEVEKAHDCWRFDAYLDLGASSAPIVVEIVNSWSDRYLDKHYWLEAEGWARNAVWVFNGAPKQWCYALDEFAKTLVQDGATVLREEGGYVAGYFRSAPIYERLHSLNPIAIAILAGVNGISTEDAGAIQAERIHLQRRAIANDRALKAAAVERAEVDREVREHNAIMRAAQVAEERQCASEELEQQKRKAHIAAIAREDRLEAVKPSGNGFFDILSYQPAIKGSNQ